MAQAFALHVTSIIHLNVTREPLYRCIRDHDVSLTGGRKDHIKQRAHCLIQELDIGVCFFLHSITLQKYFNVLSNFSFREMLRNKSKPKAIITQGVGKER